MIALVPFSIDNLESTACRRAQKCPSQSPSLSLYFEVLGVRVGVKKKLGRDSRWLVDAKNLNPEHQDS